MLLNTLFIKRPYRFKFCGDTSDKSKNTTPFDFLLLGELFQNNHHRHPNSANFGVKWFEFDPVYPVMRLMHWMRIIKLRKAY